MTDGYRALRRRVEAAFEAALVRTAGIEPLQAFHDELVARCEHLRRPMRVAVVGLIKAGKSTLINGLLGERLVATGSVETTFNVNWLRHGERPRVRLYFKDGRAPEDLGLDRLAAVTRRRRQDLEWLLEIRHVEVRQRNPLLRELEIIDTPGLESYYRQDSENTRAFLELHGKELEKATKRQASRADAVLYLFAQALRRQDQSALEQFQGPTLRMANPLNSIGVLTKADSYWPAETDPLRAGRRIAGRLADHPQVRNLFFVIRPVCGLLAEGAAALDRRDLESLGQLAKLPEERLARLVADVRRFASRAYPDVAVEPARRHQLLDRLGLYGIERACCFLRAGGNPKRLAELLRQESGIVELRDLILQHFGQRSDLIKLQNALGRIEAVYFRERWSHAGDASVVQRLEGAWGDLERLQSTEPALSELRVLRSLYQQRLELEPWELRQIREILGERGESTADRLGLTPEVDRQSLLDEARRRLDHWRWRSNETLTLRSPSLTAARTTVRALERILVAPLEPS